MEFVMRKENQGEQTGRIAWMDGLRGIFAVAVFNCHIVPNLFPAIAESKLWEILSYTPFFIFVSGGIPISYFMVLTGFAYMRQLSGRDGKTIFRKDITRYFRLLVIAFFSILLAGWGMKNGWLYLMPGNRGAEGIVFQRYMDESITFAEILYDSCIRVFWEGSHFVGPFWMLHYEFWGAILTSVLALVFQRSKYRKIIYVFMAGFLLLINQKYYFMIICGILAFDVYEVYQKKNNGKNTGSMWLCVGFLTLCLACIWRNLPVNGWRGYEYVSAVGFSICITAMLCGKTTFIQKVLESRLILFLGKNSFAIYGIHYTVAASVGCWLVQRTAMQSFWWNFCIYLICFGITIALAVVFSTVNQWMQKNIVDRIGRVER